LIVVVDALVVAFKS